MREENKVSYRSRKLESLTFLAFRGANVSGLLFKCPKRRVKRSKITDYFAELLSVDRYLKEELPIVSCIHITTSHSILTFLIEATGKQQFI